MRCGKNSNKYCCSSDDCCTRASFLKFTMDGPTVTATAGVAPTTTVATTASSDEMSTETSIPESALATTFSFETSSQLSSSLSAVPATTLPTEPLTSSRSSSHNDPPIHLTRHPSKS